MERAREKVYLRKVEQVQDHTVLNADKPNVLKDFLEKERQAEKERIKSNEVFLSNLESDLDFYGKMIVEEMKSVKTAKEMKLLIRRRIDVLTQAREISIKDNDSDVNRYDKAILRAKSFIEEINDIIDTLPDEEPNNPPSLNISLNKSEIQFHLSKMINYGMLSADTDEDYFSYAISGKAIPPKKQPYQAIKITTPNVKFLLYLQKDILNSTQKSIENRYREKAKSLFLDKKGDPLKLYNP